MGRLESSTMSKANSFECLQKKLERAYTSRLTTHLENLEQKEANTPKRNRQKEILKLRSEINEVEKNRTIQCINKTISWFFDQINKIDRPIGRQTRGHRIRIQINKIRNEK